MIEVNNRTRTKISESLLKKAAAGVLKGEHMQNKNLSIALVSSGESRALNRKYRKKNRAANVLSFEGSERSMGEVVLCPFEVKKDAKKYGMMFQEAMAFMLIHGILHLAGYRHETEKEARRMEQKEQTYLQQL